MRGELAQPSAITCAPTRHLRSASEWADGAICRCRLAPRRQPCREQTRSPPPPPRARQWVASPGRQHVSLRAQPEDAPQCALQSAGEQHLQLQLLTSPLNCQQGRQLPSFLVEKLRLREIRWFAKGYACTKRWNQTRDSSFKSTICLELQ